MCGISHIYNTVCMCVCVCVCVQAKKAREQAALKNAQILCEELDAEKEKKESKRIAAVKKREKRKKNKKKKEQQVSKVSAEGGKEAWPACDLRL